MRAFCVSAQVRRGKEAPRIEPSGDGAEEVSSVIAVEQELRHQQRAGAVERLAGRKGVEIAGVEGAAVAVAVLRGARFGGLDHARRGLHCHEVPGRKALGEEVDLGTGARADTQHAGVAWQAAEDRGHQQVNAVAKRRELRPLLVVAAGLLVEGGFQLIAVHVTSSLVAPPRAGPGTVRARGRRTPSSAHCRPRCCWSA